MWQQKLPLMCFSGAPARICKKTLPLGAPSVRKVPQLLYI